MGYNIFNDTLTIDIPVDTSYSSDNGIIIYAGCCDKNTGKFQGNANKLTLSAEYDPVDSSTLFAVSIETYKGSNTVKAVYLNTIVDPTMIPDRTTKVYLKDENGNKSTGHLEIITHQPAVKTWYPGILSNLYRYYTGSGNFAGDGTWSNSIDATDPTNGRILVWKCGDMAGKSNGALLIQYLDYKIESVEKPKISFTGNITFSFDTASQLSLTKNNYEIRYTGHLIEWDKQWSITINTWETNSGFYDKMYAYAKT